MRGAATSSQSAPGPEGVLEANDRDICRRDRRRVAASQLQHLGEYHGRRTKIIEHPLLIGGDAGTGGTGHLQTMAFADRRAVTPAPGLAANSVSGTT